MTRMPPLTTMRAAPVEAWRQTLPERRLQSLARAALFQAQRNIGAASPNPSVGAVIADPATGEILASAVTAAGGRPHAEVLAIRAAGRRAEGALLFTTLEPCSHHGETPPCADAIVAAGISAVFYGSLDPDPRVSGRGIARLRTGGVASLQAPFAGEADWLNLGHALRIAQKRPFVQIKLAVDADGRIAAGEGGQPVWVTSEEARAEAHLLRAKADAILVGRATIEHDNPKLTCRLPGLEDRSPIRIVLSRKAAAPREAAIFDGSGPPVWIVCGDGRTAESGFEWARRGVKTLPAATGPDGNVNLGAALRRLAEAGITRLLVEGGPSVARQFLDMRLADEIVIMQGARRAAGARTMLPFVDRGIERIALSPEFKRVSDRRRGPDTISVFRSLASSQG